MDPLQSTFIWYQNTLLDGKQCDGTLKRKDTSFLKDVTLSLCFSCPNVLHAIQQGVFVPCDHIQQIKGPITDSMGTSHSEQRTCLKHCD